ncbi:L,D-transpeptidase family protein [Flavobacterium sp. '19STA2R22 D10 B1']|uniref:L,D-transpeptidase family protein n=1 Tax=Flavobacterium aerium TaxID=3037261 RepID=UPI00278C0B20|nr:L,D-transpeptidase family protein [Flavobacterium sp. '19STA2R22 D10 B1']
MKLFYILFIATLFVGCKKENSAVKKVEKVIEAITPTNSTTLKKVSLDSVHLSETKNDSIIAFYKLEKNETVWNEKENRDALIKEIKNSGKEGMNPNDYPLTKIQSYENKIKSLSDDDIIQYDILLTTSYYKFINELANGKLNSKKLYNDWDLKTNKVNINKPLVTALKENEIEKMIEDNKPHHIVYLKLKDALAAIDQYPKDSPPTIQLKEKKIVLNDTNQSVINIKKKLMYWKDLKAKDSLTTVYDEDTQKAVKKFQKRHGLQADGVIGAGTVAALNISKAKRKEQIIANLERWKWYPKNMGKSYLIINIPDYMLSVVKDNDTVKTHRVIVGKEKRRTPILSSKLNYIVYNPTWTVPPTILKEDVIPATSRNFGYLDSKNITVYDKNNNVVDERNWKSQDAKAYRYVQSPGDYNSLGRMKIIFPNPYLVYLHDTNNRSLFNNSFRALSSGCIRVENPMDLSEYLLDDSKNWTKDKINETLATKKTKNVNIKDNIYIHQLYWTAWMDGNELQFRDDIYKFDAGLYQKLRN